MEKVLFEERPVVRISKQQKDLVFHNILNEFQQEAVTGAMTANDLYVIQGPPGTGKTTVISEICHQNVKAGLRTLVASQANLAVDNALGRLLSHQDIGFYVTAERKALKKKAKSSSRKMSHSIGRSRLKRRFQNNYDCVQKLKRTGKRIETRS